MFLPRISGFAHAINVAKFIHGIDPNCNVGGIIISPKAGRESGNNEMSKVWVGNGLDIKSNWNPAKH